MFHSGLRALLRVSQLISAPDPEAQLFLVPAAGSGPGIFFSSYLPSLVYSTVDAVVVLSHSLKSY